MRRLKILTNFRGNATQPAGEPPTVDVKSSSESIETSAGDGPAPDLGALSYQTHVTFTGETTFTETGTISAGGEDELEIVTSARARSRLAPTHSSCTAR